MPALTEAALNVNGPFRFAILNAPPLVVESCEIIAVPTLFEKSILPPTAPFPVAVFVNNKFFCALLRSDAIVIEYEASGLFVPTPTNPAFVTTNFVLVVDPIAKAGAEPSPITGLIDSLAQGVDVPTPMNPVLVIVVVALVPKKAYPADRAVVDALPSNLNRDVVAEDPANG
jgi:hypothetical protein